MKLLASYETPGFDFFEAHIFSTVLVIFDYILSSTGRFDLNWFTVHCSSCQWKWSPISVDSIIESGWWPGSPENFHYIFSQDVFNLWDAFRKRMPGSSQSAFVRSLEDISSSRGRVIIFYAIYISLLVCFLLCVYFLSCKPKATRRKSWFQNNPLWSFLSVNFGKFWEVKENLFKICNKHMSIFVGFI